MIDHKARDRLYHSLEIVHLLYVLGIGVLVDVDLGSKSRIATHASLLCDDQIQIEAWPNTHSVGRRRVKHVSVCFVKVHSSEALRRQRGLTVAIDGDICVIDIRKGSLVEVLERGHYTTHGLRRELESI
jgi:hypothetical protein